MISIRRPAQPIRRRIQGMCLVAAAAGLLALPLQASAQAEHIVLEVEDSLGIPAIQALISACLGEQVLLTGTVRITTVDGALLHVNWGGMRGETLDGDLFVGGSSAGDQQSNLTLTEVGAGQDSRLIHIQIVAGQLSVTCH